MTGSPLRLVLASANPDKAVEIAAILGAAVVLLPRPAEVPDVAEDALDLEGNARLKAAALARATGLGAVADDTGLEVDALDGRPGVYSARYAGDGATYLDNVTKLLGELAASGAGGHVAGDRGVGRTARFRTVALALLSDGSELVAHGVSEGTIADGPRGAGGFGYDSVFVPADGDGRTFAELAPDEKHALSHRGRAFRALAAKLAAEES